MTHTLALNWDHDLLEQTFWQEDAEIIKAIPVHHDMDDVIAWHFDVRGLFSVRSAYKVHRENLWTSGGTMAVAHRLVMGVEMWAKPCGKYFGNYPARAR